MKVIGLFRELDTQINQDYQSINEIMNKLPKDNVSKILTYLRSGVGIFDVMGATPDPFDRFIGVPGGPSLVSDGIWIWRHDLAFFVEKYKIALPEEFVSYAIENKVVTANEGLLLNKSDEIIKTYYLAEKVIS